MSKIKQKVLKVQLSKHLEFKLHVNKRLGRFSTHYKNTLGRKLLLISLCIRILNFLDQVSFIPSSVKNIAY